MSLYNILFIPPYLLSSCSDQKTHQSVGVGVVIVLHVPLVPLGFRPSRRAERGQQRRAQHSSRQHVARKRRAKFRALLTSVLQVSVCPPGVCLSSRCLSVLQVSVTRCRCARRDVLRDSPAPQNPGDVTGVT